MVVIYQFDDDEYGPENLTDLNAVLAWNEDVSITVSITAGQETRVTGIN